MLSTTRANGRGKMTDGLFHKVFDAIGSEYAEIEKEHWIVDIPEAFCVDQFRCRFMAPDGERPVSSEMIAALLAKAAGAGIDVT